MIHLILHFLIPAVITVAFFSKNWKKAYLFMMLTMIVDIDHLLAIPIYDAARCSINFHPLHGFYFIAAYALMCVPKQTRLFGIGLIIHMLLDSIDCQMTNNIWFTGQ